MHRFVRFAAVVACCVAAASIGVQAVDADDIVTPNLPNVRPGQLYDRGSIWPDRDFQPVDLPAPGVTDMQRAFGSGAASRPGPLATPADLVKGSTLGSGAIVGPAGGFSIYSPQQRADREIRRLIRRLD